MRLTRPRRPIPASRETRLLPRLDSDDQDLLTAEDLRLERSRIERLVEDERRRESAPAPVGRFL